MMKTVCVHEIVDFVEGMQFVHGGIVLTVVADEYDETTGEHMGEMYVNAVGEIPDSMPIRVYFMEHEMTEVGCAAIIVDGAIVETSDSVGICDVDVREI